MKKRKRKFTNQPTSHGYAEQAMKTPAFWVVLMTSLMLRQAPGTGPSAEFRPRNFNLTVFVLANTGVLSSAAFSSGGVAYVSPTKMDNGEGEHGPTR